MGFFICRQCLRNNREATLFKKKTLCFKKVVLCILHWPKTHHCSWLMELKWKSVDKTVPRRQEDFFSILKHNYSPDYVVPLFETLIHCWKLLNCSKCWGVAKILIEYFKHCYIAENSISIVLTCDFCIFISSSFDHELTYFLITVLMKSPSINCHLSFLRAPYPKRPNSRIK